MAQRGFTLIEILIYVLMIGIIALTFVTFTIDITTSAQKSRLRQEIQQEARFAIGRITQEIRSADDLNTGSSTFNASSGVLSLATNLAGNNPTIFDLNSSRLRIKQGAAAAEFLTSDKFTVTNFFLENLSVTNRTKNIKITLTMEHPNPQNTEIYNVDVTLQGSALIREKAD